MYIIMDLIDLILIRSREAVNLFLEKLEARKEDGVGETSASN